MRLIGQLCVFVFGALLPLHGAGPIPLAAGTVWTYRAAVKWTSVAPGGVQSTNLHWTMEVLGVVTNGVTRAAIVRGFPDELMGYEPGRVARCWVVLDTEQAVYRVLANGPQAAARLAHGGRSVGQYPDRPRSTRVTSIERSGSDAAASAPHYV